MHVCSYLFLARSLARELLASALVMQPSALSLLPRLIRRRLLGWRKLSATALTHSLFEATPVELARRLSKHLVYLNLNKPASERYVSSIQVLQH